MLVSISVARSDACPVAVIRSPGCSVGCRQVRLTSLVELNKSGVPGAVHASLRLLSPWAEMLLVDLQHTPTEAETVSRLVGSLGPHSGQLQARLTVRGSLVPLSPSSPLLP